MMQDLNVKPEMEASEKARARKQSLVEAGLSDEEAEAIQTVKNAVDYISNNS